MIQNFIIPAIGFSKHSSRDHSNQSQIELKKEFDSSTARHFPNKSTQTSQTTRFSVHYSCGLLSPSLSLSIFTTENKL